ncbi:MAG: DUF4416 family protein [Deltaproteobacteria bacterium]|jgi:hypothetical protein|nr:DUF4416 family protein [Deltaproteobacteria bacterium]
MSILQDPPEVKIFLAVYSQEPALNTEVASRLGREFLGGSLGPIDIESRDFPILDTNYYTAEMGPNLLKRYMSFTEHKDPGLLVDMKLLAMDLERQYLSDGKRRINLDPGYIFSGGLVLSTGKFSSHRLYLGRKVWGELTVLYQNKGIYPLPWSYRDYLMPEVKDLLIAMRKAYFKRKKTNTKTS